MLDPYQSEVLNTSYKKDLLIGGFAGTGKTVTVYKLGEEYEPERVLYLSHTMRQREAGRLHFPKWSVHDVHSFALQQVHRWSPHPPKAYPGHSQILQGYLELETKDEYDLVVVEESHNFSKGMGRVIKAIPAGRRVAIYDPMQRTFYYNHDLCHPSSYLRDGYETRELLWNWRSSPEVIRTVNKSCGTHLEAHGPNPTIRGVGILAREKKDVASLYYDLKEQGVAPAYWNSSHLNKLVRGNKTNLFQLMTIHMSQGSEFKTGLIGFKTGLFTSELEVLYVAMTRFARSFAVLVPPNLEIPNVLCLSTAKQVAGFLEVEYANL